MWSKIRSSLNDDGIKNSIYTKQLKSDIKKIAAFILATAKNDKEINEVGFFKSKTKVSNAIRLARAKMKTRIKFHLIK